MTDLRHRQAEADLQLLYPDGTPAAGASVAVDQTAHAFLFGCGATEAEALARAPEEARPQLEARLEKWLGLFNYGTLHFYWGRYEPEERHPRREPMVTAAQILSDRGVRLKGHPLCWHTACADWLLRFSDEEILRRQINRIHRDVADFRGMVDMWDVINEVVIMPDFDRYDNAVTRICKMKGRIGLVKEVFAAAREVNPEATLLINDFNTGTAYEVLIDGLLQAGVPVSAIGIQSHQHQGYWGLEKLNDVLERYSRFGVPLHFTENTLISGELMPPHIVDLNDWQVASWPTTPEGEERQAAEVTEMYTTLFRCPAVEAITSWDFTDRCWLNAPAGFLRADDTEKPSYHALRKLIHGDWETHARVTADSEGRVRFTGFKGQYCLDTGRGKAALDLTQDCTGVVTLAL